MGIFIQKEGQNVKLSAYHDTRTHFKG